MCWFSKRARLGMGLGLGLVVACNSGGSAADGGDDGDDAGPDTGAETGGSSAGEGSEGGESGGETGGVVAGGLARVGVFASRVNYFELDIDGGPLMFHFGAGNSKWGANAAPIAGDWDGDGFDTIGLYDLVAGTFHLADENDSDEHGPREITSNLTEIPEPPAMGEAAGQLPLAGDWDGDGVDGIGLFHPGSNTFYLRNGTDPGPADIVLTLGTADGFPAGGRPLSGDWDGDGLDDLGIFARGTAYLRVGLDAGAPDYEFEAPGGQAVAGDFDEDGIDTVATYAGATGTFTIRNAHEENGSSTVALGHVDPGFWAWSPIAGVWQVPDSPVASRGYAWTEGDPAANGIGPAALGNALDEGANVTNVLSVLVARNGELVGERYYHGYDRHIAGNIKSVSKSVLSAVYGIALDQGVLGSTDDPVSSYLPTYFQGVGAGKQGITLMDLLTMRGGLRWSEGPSFISNGMIPSPNFVEYVVGQSLVQQPGTTYNYSTGLTHVASAALTEAAGMSTRAYARQHLFEPLGITAPRWDGSPEGYFVGGAEMWMRPRDMARFGQVFLDGGESIVPADWVQTSANPWIPESGGRNYGLWWRERPWSNYPANDTYFAWGYGGQFIFLFPSWDMVVVVTSKWNVNGAQSGSSASAIFSFVNNQVLTAVQG